MSIVLRARRLVGYDLLVAGWQSYLSALERRPGRTLALNTCLLMGTGDVVAQLVLERRGRRTCSGCCGCAATAAVDTVDAVGSRRCSHQEPGGSPSPPYDFVRTVRFCFVGLTMAGPAMHVWYRALDRTIRGTGMRAAVRKTAADQLLFLPVYVAAFVSVMAALRGDGPGDIARLLSRDMGAMLAASYAIWPAVQLANFRYVPSRHRVLVINIVCLFWNTFIGWRAERQLTHAAMQAPSVDTISN